MNKVEDQILINDIDPSGCSKLLKPRKMTQNVGATVCSNCGTTTTPLWRRAPNGDTICNACGLYLKARNNMRPIRLKNSQRKHGELMTKDVFPTTGGCGSGNGTGSCPGGGQCNGMGGSSSCAGCPAFNQHQVNRQLLVCANCQATTTPLWRRDEAGNTICNACGLYYKLHGTHRPTSMKRSVIKRRKRVIVYCPENENENTEQPVTTGVTELSDPSKPVKVKKEAVPTVMRKRRAKKDIRKETDVTTPTSTVVPQHRDSPDIPAIEDYITPVRKREPEVQIQYPSANTEYYPVNRSPSLPLHSSPLTQPLPPSNYRLPRLSGSSPNLKFQEEKNNFVLPLPVIPSLPIASDDNANSVSLPPILPERQSPRLESAFSRRLSSSSASSSTTSYSLPPISYFPTSLSSPFSQTSSYFNITGNSNGSPNHEWTEFDSAFERLGRLRRQIKSEHMTELSAVSHLLSDFVNKAESIVFRQRGSASPIYNSTPRLS
ncbi:uncharacterized protein BYT42DRAFT_564442 [Radiomyces spectabilis]|uniref:uncharacterized protein n=1 Tax=Radiomyces spectabilis TaxID=64574 RepID=UPI002220BEE3|nr:uncharacterized protein BYT42DRAFT_564442 [Radiomyces spectabilis]KAI8385025.1 hypothetical protein BYT42DRAFT_564442 [Radiomyces spectabilis]